MITDLPARPAGVPEAATYVPPAADFAGLRDLHEARADKRSLLRVWFPFVIFRISGPLRYVMPRALEVRPTRHGEYAVWSFTLDGPVPGVWVWTLDDERSGGAS